MAENYVTNQYSFESRESYEQTKKEAEQIKKLIHSADLKNPKIALKIYNKCVSDKMFHTMAGYNFLMELRHFIGKSGLVSEQSLAPIPIKEENEKKPDVILFGGNLFGRHTKEVTVDKTLASIKKMKAALGIYMVEGSADSVLVEEKKEKISGAGVHLLLDESAVLHNGLQLVGCRADGKTKKPMSYTLSLINKEKPSIVLAGEAMEEKRKEEKKISLVLYPKKITDTGNGGTSGVNQMFPRNVLASAKINFMQIKK